jgi:hypothetical protein
VKFHALSISLFDTVSLVAYSAVEESEAVNNAPYITVLPDIRADHYFNTKKQRASYILISMHYWQGSKT